MSVVIRAMTERDWPAVRDIFEQGIATKNATFEKEPPDWDDWNASHLHVCRFVAVEKHDVIGWAALSSVSNRRVYIGVAEVSIYIADSAQGRGVGFLLLQKLIDASEQNGFWTLQAGIFPENDASIHLHEKCGFRLVGRREKLGQMDGLWRDVVLLERRSSVVGL